MKILLIEDTPQKKVTIESYVNELCNTVSHSLEIVAVDNLRDARRKIIGELFDLVIFDIYLPDTHDSDQAENISTDILLEFSQSRNYKTESIALTQYEVSEIENIKLFNAAGVTVVKYDSTDSWKESLKQKVHRLQQHLKYDFLVFCALSKERDAFRQTEAEVGEMRKIHGIDCLEIAINGYHGLVIKPHSMGLVNMAITSSKAIELFQPKIVGMSGICAGVQGETNFLDLIVASVCWEYQTGKWKDGVFKQEPYQACVDRSLQIDLSHMATDERVLKKIKHELFYDDIRTSKVTISPLSSGSAVIADEEKMAEIGIQHRKMAGLEMEMYAMYEASEQSLCKPLHFGAKAVVDLGTSSKGDELHEPACVLSARFVTEFILKKLVEINPK